MEGGTAPKSTNGEMTIIPITHNPVQSSKLKNMRTSNT